jgi:hypothetical protein
MTVAAGGNASKMEALLAMWKLLLAIEGAGFESMIFVYLRTFAFISGQYQLRSSR